MTETTTPNVSTLPLAAGQWTIDTAHSNVTFAIRHLGVSKVRGRFNTFDANLTVGDTLDDTSIEAVIDVTSLDTGNLDRDGHVLSPDLLDVAKRPELRFTSHRITGADDEWKLEGEASLGDVTKPLTLDVEFGGVGDFMGTPHAGFSATGELHRADFGLDFPGPAALALGKVVRFELELQFLPPSN